MEDIYKIILEETLAGYWDYYIPENRVILSPVFKAMFGYQDDELPNTTATWARLILQEDRPLMDNCVQGHYKSHGEKPYNVEVRYRHKNGSIIWVNSTGRVIEWDGDTPLRMVGCHFDITQRKKAEHKLAISEETLRNAFEHSSIGMVLVSLEGKFLKANQSICKLLGYTHEELLEKTFQEITHPADLEADLQMLKKALNKEITNYHLEKRYFTKSGAIIWILLNVSLVLGQDGEPLYFVSQIKDINERRKAEHALRESERRWIFASEGTGGGLWDWDIKNEATYYSDQCLRMIGMERSDVGTILGKWVSRVHPDDREKHLAALQAHLRGETDIYINQHRILCKDNTYKWLMDRGKVMEYDQDSNPIRMIGTHTDIDEQKLKEEQLRNTLDVVSGQNNRLLNFAYIVSHNLRTHSSNFKMIMDIMADPEASAEEKEELAGHLLKVSEQLNETITNLNEVVSIQTNIDIQTAEINLRNYFNKAIELLSNDIAMWKVQVDIRIPSDVNLIHNPAYMESIILNLLSNGIKYRSATQPPAIAIDYFTDADGKHGFTVADNGLGINLQKNGADLFGMYKTFHGNRDAKGIGLFITKNQVEAFGGKIEVESQPGLGTTFKVYLG